MDREFVLIDPQVCMEIESYWRKNFPTVAEYCNNELPDVGFVLYNIVDSFEPDDSHLFGLSYSESLSENVCGTCSDQIDCVASFYEEFNAKEQLPYIRTGTLRAEQIRILSEETVKHLAQKIYWLYDGLEMVSRKYKKTPRYQHYRPNKGLIIRLEDECQWD